MEAFVVRERPVHQGAINNCNPNPSELAWLGPMASSEIGLNASRVFWFVALMASATKARERD